MPPGYSGSLLLVKKVERSRGRGAARGVVRLSTPYMRPIIPTGASRSICSLGPGWARKGQTLSNVRFDGAEGGCDGVGLIGRLSGGRSCMLELIGPRAGLIGLRSRPVAPRRGLRGTGRKTDPSGPRPNISLHLDVPRRPLRGTPVRLLARARPDRVYRPAVSPRGSSRRPLPLSLLQPPGD